MSIVVIAVSTLEDHVYKWRGDVRFCTLTSFGVQRIYYCRIEPADKKMDIIPYSYISTVAPVLSISQLKLLTRRWGLGRCFTTIVLEPPRQV